MAVNCKHLKILSTFDQTNFRMFNEAKSKETQSLYVRCAVRVLCTVFVTVFDEFIDIIARVFTKYKSSLCLWSQSFSEKICAHTIALLNAKLMIDCIEHELIVNSKPNT